MPTRERNAHGGEQENMKLCPHCSHQLEDEAVRCGNCSGWVVPNRKGTKKRAQPGKNGLKTLILLLAVAVLSWFVWIKPGGILNSGAAADPEPSRSAILAIMESDLERLQALQEAYFRNHGEYSGKPSELAFTPSEKVTVSIIATPSGWSGASTYKEFPPDFGCAIFEGSALPPPNPATPSDPGEVQCSEGIE